MYRVHTWNTPVHIGEVPGTTECTLWEGPIFGQFGRKPRQFLKSNHFYDTNLHTAHHIACWNRDLGDHLDMYGVQITVLHTLLLWTSFLFISSFREWVMNEKTEIFSGKFVSTRTTYDYPR